MLLVERGEPMPRDAGRKCMMTVTDCGFSSSFGGGAVHAYTVSTRRTTMAAEARIAWPQLWS